MTDYTGVTLADILAHFRDWQVGLQDSVAVLGNIRTRLESAGPDPRISDGLETIDAFIDLFDRYLDDFERLLKEMPRGVLPRHIETVRQLYESAAFEEGQCVAFKRNYHLDALQDRDRVQNIFAEVYRLTRDELIDMKDLSNVVSRLRAVAVTPGEVAAPSDSAVNALELKPNFFGVGLNLNWMIDRWRDRNKR